MSDNIIQLNEDLIKHDLKDLVRSSVEETLNALPDKEADELVNAQKYERSADRQGYRSGHYKRNFQTTAGDIELKVPKLKGVPFETAIIERYRRRESSVEEALIEMYLAGVSVRRVEDITEALWGTKVSPGTISNLNKKAYEHIETWRTRPLTGSYPYVYVDGVYLKRSWGGEIQNVSILVAIGVSNDGCREIIGAAEGMKEDKESRRSFFVWLKKRGLTGVRLIIGDKNPGMLETIPEVFPDARYQRCTVHFYRNIFSVIPRNKMKAVILLFSISRFSSIPIILYAFLFLLVLACASFSLRSSTVVRFLFNIPRAFVLATRYISIFHVLLYLNMIYFLKISNYWEAFSCQNYLKC